ncbi:MAG TPA: class I SAM-dependent methyltransferase [Kiloniellales bacterium]|nr:class I SAM-dependent methyltransferase [Kiloniellales bacterium]
MSEERIAEPESGREAQQPEKQPAPPPRPPRLVRDAERLRRGQLKRLDRKVRIKGEVLLPCLPALLDEYVSRLSSVFGTLGKAFSAEEIAELRKLLGIQVEKGFAKSSLNQLKVVWWSDDAKDLAVHYRIFIVERSKSGQYEHWVKTRKPPLFGSHPDAMVMELAKRLPANARIADLGAGTGRNTIPLAAAGYRVDAIDSTASFVQAIRRDAKAKGVADRVVAMQADLFAAPEILALGAYHIVLLSQVVPDLRRLSDLRHIFARAERLLRSGGYLLFNTFVAGPGYQPDRITRELSQYMWSWVLTRDELDEARRGMHFDLVIDEDAHDYERARLPEWPPTGWYSHWARGNDLFGLGENEVPPVGLRWLAYRKRG